MNDFFAVVNNTQFFNLEDQDEEGRLADYLEDICGDSLCPITGVPWFMEASSWCFNPRCEGDDLDAYDVDGNMLFHIDIVLM